MRTSLVGWYLCREVGRCGVLGMLCNSYRALSPAKAMKMQGWRVRGSRRGPGQRLKEHRQGRLVQRWMCFRDAMWTARHVVSSTAAI